MKRLKDYVSAIMISNNISLETSKDATAEEKELIQENYMMVNIMCSYGGDLMFTPNGNTVSDIEKLHSFSIESQEHGMHILLMNILSYHKLANGINDYMTEGLRYEYVISGDNSVGIELTNGDKSTVIKDVTISKLLLAEPQLDQNLVRILTEILSKLIIYKSLII